MLTFDEAVAEIKGGHQAVFDAVGWVDPFFRFPYGESSNELKKYLKANSVGEFFLNVDSEDWKAQSNASMPKYLVTDRATRSRHRSFPRYPKKNSGGLAA